jgi:heme exporter protein D
MNWTSWQNFAHMGGYGLYVWGSYGVTFLLLAAEVVYLAKRKVNPQHTDSQPIGEDNAG